MWQRRFGAVAVSLRFEMEWFICICNIEMHSQGPQNETTFKWPAVDCWMSYIYTYGIYVYVCTYMCGWPFPPAPKTVAKCSISQAKHFGVKLINEIVFFCCLFFSPLALFFIIEFNGFLMSLKRSFWRHFKKVQFHYRLILFITAQQHFVIGLKSVSPHRPFSSSVVVPHSCLARIPSVYFKLHVNFNLFTHNCST